MHMVGDGRSVRGNWRGVGVQREGTDGCLLLLVTVSTWSHRAGHRWQCAVGVRSSGAVTAIVLDIFTIKT